MSKKGKGKKQENLDDDYEFLIAAAAANQQKKADIESQKILIEEEIKETSSTLPNLPESPSVSFPNREYPEGEYLDYNESQLWRKTDQELKEVERIQYLQSIVSDLREGAEIHRKVRIWAMENVIKPGVLLYDMSSQIEEAVRRLSGFQPLTRCLAFPCGCSLNNCAAHYTPLSNDKRTLKPDDVMKIDFGVSINGNIIDSAFTVCFDSKFDSLVQASKDATNTGVKMAGIDARLSEIGDAIHEVFDAASLDINGKHYDIKPISNLCGHLLKPYIIHAGKSIPICRGGTQERMEEGELYACETFASTGKGRVIPDHDLLSHYMFSQNPHIPRTPKQRELLKNLQNNFSTLGFCPRFIDNYGEKKYQISLKQLVECHAVNPYPAVWMLKVVGFHNMNILLFSFQLIKKCFQEEVTTKN